MFNRLTDNRFILQKYTFFPFSPNYSFRNYGFKCKFAPKYKNRFKI